MRAKKTEVTTVKLTPQLRDLWERCAEQEHRTLTNALEMMVLAYARQLGIAPNPDAKPRREASV